MGVQKPANTGVWGAPFHADIEWKQRFKVCLYALAYIYFSYHSTIYRPCADFTAQSFTSSFASLSCHHRTQENELEEKETLSLLCELRTERKQSEHLSWLLLFPVETGGGPHRAHHACFSLRIQSSETGPCTPGHGC